MLIDINKIQNIPNQYFSSKLAKYVESMQSGEIFPSIEVRKATNGYWLLDGAHRLKAHVLCSRTKIEAKVRSK